MTVKWTVLALLPALAFISTTRLARAQADQDSRSVEKVLEARNAELDSLLGRESQIDTTGINDLLNQISDIDSLMKKYEGWDRESNRLRFSLSPLAFSTYNRVEGSRVGIGFGVEDERSIDADLAIGYGFSSHRWSGFGRFTWGETERPAIRIEAEDRTVPFGPNRIEYAAGLLSLLAGQDRQDYLRRRGGALTLWPLRKNDRSLWASVSSREELSMPARKHYSLFGGGTPMEEENPGIDRGRTHAVLVGGTLSLRGELFDLAGEAGVAGGELGGDFDYGWQAGRATIHPVFPDGGVLTLSVEGARIGGAGRAPVQALPYLGGDGNLRGYGRLQFVGTSRMSARLEYATGVDLLGRTGIGFLKMLRLQFIPFADVGTTWGEATGVEKSTDALDGDLRSSVGIGFRRELWLPGIQAVRLDVIHRADGSEDPWGFWFRILPLRLE